MGNGFPSQKNKQNKYTMRVVIKYGLSSITKGDVEEGTTVGQLIEDRNIRASLGYGESINTLINGDTVDLEQKVEDGETILVEKRSASKA